MHLLSYVLRFRHGGSAPSTHKSMTQRMTYNGLKNLQKSFQKKKVVSSGESMTSNFSLMCVSSTKGTIQLRFSMFLQYKLRAFVQVKLDAIFLTLENSILSNSLGCWLDLEIKTPLWMC